MIIDRRRFLGAMASAGFGAVGAGCTDAAPQTAGMDGGRDGSAGGTDAGATTDATTANVTDGGTVRARVVIIGTGFGGAVTALRLAQAGIPSVMLERGRRWTLTSANNTFARLLAPDGRSAWFESTTNLPFGPTFRIPRYAGVLERVRGNGIDLYAGAGVGGGSLVYGGMVVTPRESAFTRVYPSAIPYAEMRDVYYPRAAAMLRTTTIPDDVIANPAYDAERVFRAHAAAAHVEATSVGVAADWEVVRREIAGTAPPSTLIGECIVGNSNGSKHSLDRTYLAAAEATGMTTIAPLHRVRDVAVDGSGGYLVFVDRIDEDGTVLETKTYACEYLFMAAGTYGTTNLLVKARAKGLMPRLDEHVGQGFGNNGNAMFMRWGLTETTGPRQASFAGQAMVDFDNPVAPALVEHAQFPTGIEGHCLLQLGMALDIGRGSFRYDPAADRSVVDWPDGANATPVAAMQNLADRLNNASGGTLRGSSLGIEINGILGGFTYHPLGGMVLGEACDYHGRVNGHPKLYVVDSALLPRSAGGVNPALTVTALAERCVEDILAHDFR